MIELKSKLGKLYLRSDHEKAYEIIDAYLNPGDKFINRYKRKISFIAVHKVGNTYKIRFLRESGERFDTTFFKFSRNIDRCNLVPILDKYRAYKKKKLIINNN